MTMMTMMTDVICGGGMARGVSSASPRIPFLQVAWLVLRVIRTWCYHTAHHFLQSSSCPSGFPSGTETPLGIRFFSPTFWQTYLPKAKKFTGPDFQSKKEIHKHFYKIHRSVYSAVLTLDSLRVLSQTFCRKLKKKCRDPVSRCPAVRSFFLAT